MLKLGLSQNPIIPVMEVPFVIKTGAQDDLQSSERWGLGKNEYRNFGSEIHNLPQRFVCLFRNIVARLKRRTW
jgi:hypothetical protein